MRLQSVPSTSIRHFRAGRTVSIYNHLRLEQKTSLSKIRSGTYDNQLPM